MTERDELHLLSGAYALNALEHQEKTEFEAFIADSEELRTEVTGLSDTAVLLGLSSRPVTPSPELKSTIMDLLASTPQLSPEPALRPVAALDDQRTIDRIASGAHVAPRRASGRASARWFTRTSTVLLSAAAAAALLVGGIALGSLQTDPLDQLATASDLQTEVTDVAGGGTATLIWSDDQRRSAMLLEDLPELSADEVYQLWYIDGSGATSAGVIAATGDRLQLLEGDRSSDDSVGITVEPRGGSEAPTTDPIVVIGEA